MSAYDPERTFYGLRGSTSVCRKEVVSVRQKIGRLCKYAWCTLIGSSIVSQLRKATTMRHKIFLVAATVTALLGEVFFQPALANERVQLKAFKAQAIKNRQGKQRLILISVILDVESKDNAKQLCNYAPKYLDVISTHLNRNTYPLNSKGKLDIAVIRNDLEPVIKKVDRYEMILKVDVVQGVPKLGKAGRVLDRVGCVLVPKRR